MKEKTIHKTRNIEIKVVELNKEELKIHEDLHKQYEEINKRRLK
jgi:hypothetical protein